MEMDINVQDSTMMVRASLDNGDAEASEGGEVTPTDVYVVQDENGIMEPKVGMKFVSEDAVKTFYDEYARRLGFTTRTCETGRFKTDSAVSYGSRQFICAKQGSKRRLSEICKAMLKIELKGNKWAVTKFVKEHNHAIESPNKENYLRPYRHFAGALNNVAENYRASVVVPSGVMYVSMNGNGSHTSAEANHETRSPVESHHQEKGTNCMNCTVRPSIVQIRTLGKDAQNMLDYFRKIQAENPGFFYAIQLDIDNRMANAFWADARSRTAYSHFGDVVTLDTSYRVNQYKVPFAPFMGVNHHGQSILFGCALLLDDSEPSFVWLLKTFLTAMGDYPPVSIVTDQYRAIKAAVSQVLPKARHCISKWHVLREGQERLAHVCRAYPNFQVELYNCINLTETIEEFESSWASVIDKYDLSMNDWLKSLYTARIQWAPVYFRDSFFAAISPNQGADTSYFDGFVNQQTTLPMFFRQYERAMEYWFEKEIEADFDTISNRPVLRTPSPMEKQAAKLYTRKIFAKFQEELVETFIYTANRVDDNGATSCTFRVAKFEDDHKAYTVILNISDMKASCSCQMFEYSGVLCRHILTVFTVTNVLTLPSHYILRRWTWNAKSMVESGEHGVEHAPKSMTSRYNCLCREGIMHAEEGAISPETYTIALTSLREGRKTIPQMPRVGPTSYDDKKSSSVVDNPLLWPRQDECTQQYNLNDSTSHPDYNVLRMAPVSIQRDDGPTDNMAALPCLKSMTWAMENKNSTPANRVAIINLKLQNYSKSPTAGSEVKFQLTRVTLEPMLRSMANISEQLSSPVNRVAVIKLKLQDSETSCGESEVKFQVSRDTLGAMLRSMAYIREQLSLVGDLQPEPPSKKPRK